VARYLEMESGPAASVAQSLTRDFLFFVAFVGQVVLFLIFFWEKPTTTKRWNVGEEAANTSEEEEEVKKGENEAKVEEEEEEKVSGEREGGGGLKAPPEGSRAVQEGERATTEMDEDFAPLETTIRDLQHRITGLERTLHRRKGHYPTESLKSRLRECISTITGTLASLDAHSETHLNSPADVDRSLFPNRIDITRWPLESIQSSKRHLELQLQQLEDANTDKSDKTDSPIVGHDLGLDEQDLNALAQQLIGPKKTRKGGKVKISTKDLATLNFFSTQDDPRDPSPDSPSLDSPSLDSTALLSPSLSLPLESSAPSQDTITEPISHDLSPSVTSSSPPSADNTTSTLPDEDKTTATTENPTADDDELADLAALMASAPGKKGKNANNAKKDKKDKHHTPTVAKVSAGPATIFNMFDAPSSPAQEDPSPAASPSDSPRSNSSRESGYKDDTTKDLLASLGATDLPSLDDLALPNDFTLPPDDDVAVGDSTDDLMAALNAVSDAQLKKATTGSDDDNSDDNDSTSGDDDDDSKSSTEDEEDDEIDEIAMERPAVSSFGVSEALNKSGLQRAKKSVPLNKGGKKGSYQMEDFHFCEFPWVQDTWGLFCVFDGHSGKDCAETASRVLPMKLKERIEKIDLLNAPSGGIDLSDILQETFLETDKELLEFEYEGCTCTVVFVYKTKNGHRYMQAANVGDSSACLIRKEKAIELTQDHHPNYPKEFERLQAMGVDISPGATRLNGLAVSRALGDQFPKSTDCGIIASPTVSPIYELRDSDSFIILASDGLWDVINFQTAYNIIKDCDTAPEMSDALLKTATRSSKCTDNVTTIVVQL